MRAAAPVLVLAAIRVGLDEVLSLPLGTLLLIVVVEIWLATEVLPVVSIDADVSRVLGVTIRAPDGLKVEDIKIRCVVVASLPDLG